jgi:energy-coupling factor transporter ATP-binding protein EcfA2
VPPVLALEGVSKSFGAVAALRDVRLELAAGEAQALVGENGAGKSTLVKILAGVHAPETGRVLLHGEPVAPEPATPPHRGWRQVVGSWDAVVIVALVAVIVVGSLTIDGVGNPRFYRFVILEAIPIALIALPMTLIVITGEIDLSVASTVGLSCVVLGELWHLGITSLPVLVALTLLLGALLGAVNGEGTCWKPTRC